jgi:uncharacterized spore protein YtfJ
MDIAEILRRVRGSERVYGEPYEKDGVTVIPASTVWAGGGFGTGHYAMAALNVIAESSEAAPGEGSGGGGGTISRPVGAYVIKNGEARWVPAVDVNRVILGAQILVALALILLTRRRKSR